ncbi:MAG TPA: response regulator [Caulobacteraceae bacterium]
MAADDDRAAAQPRVLVVEDEMLVQMLVLDVVGDLGLEALEANDAPSALRVLAEGPIDLMVTDVGLPGMNGRQLAEAARALRPGLKIIFVTGYGEGLDLDGLGDGVDMITKPFALDDLSQKIAAMLQRA